MEKIISVLTVIFILLAITACSAKDESIKNSISSDTESSNVDEAAEKEVEYMKITQEKAKEIMDSDEEIIILDVRSQSEFDAGHIKNAVLIPDTEIGKTAEEKLTDKDKKILVYCRSGRRSEAAAKKLIEMGYTNVMDFGGIQSWTYGTVK